VAWAAALALARVAEATVVHCGLGESNSLNAKQTLYLWALAIQGAVFLGSVAGAVGAVASRRGPRLFAFIAFFLSALASAVVCVVIFVAAFAEALGCGTA
jgi:hypothetical protein